MQYLVTNLSDSEQTVAGVGIEPGQTRDLLDLGVSYEAIQACEELRAGVEAGDLEGPPQLALVSDSDSGRQLLDGESVAAVSLAGPLSLVLPSAAQACLVPTACTSVCNLSDEAIALTLPSGSGILPDATALTVAAGACATFKSAKVSGAWTWLRV